MINSELKYWVTCDRCGQAIEFDGSEIICDDESEAEGIVKDAGWTERDGKHFCPECAAELETGEERKPSFRGCDFRIGDEVTFRTGLHEDRESIPMTVTGIFTDFHDPDDVTLYLDFEENEGDVWEVNASEIVRIKRKY